jgi:hypothetical protein
MTARKFSFSNVVDNFGVMIMKLQSRGCSCEGFRTSQESVRNWQELQLKAPPEKSAGLSV